MSTELLTYREELHRCAFPLTSPPLAQCKTSSPLITRMLRLTVGTGALTSLCALAAALTYQFTSLTSNARSPPLALTAVAQSKNRPSYPSPPSFPLCPSAFFLSNLANIINSYSISMLITLNARNATLLPSAGPSVTMHAAEPAAEGDPPSDTPPLPSFVNALPLPMPLRPPLHRSPSTDDSKNSLGVMTVLRDDLIAVLPRGRGR